MKVLIIEDEHHAALRLQSLIKKLVQTVDILAVLDSVEDSVEWFQSNQIPDLVFMDIQLADGISFSIFQEVEIQAPVIFTTAFDQYSLKAFKVNSIDYLLKPIDSSELHLALKKYQNIYHKDSPAPYESLNQFLKNWDNQKNYKERFLIKKKDKYSFILSNEIAYFFSEDSLTFIVTKNEKTHIFDQSLNKLEPLLNPKQFFRINRKKIVHINAIQSFQGYLNNRLKIELIPAPKEAAIVSREKMKAFKEWVNL